MFENILLFDSYFVKSKKNKLIIILHKKQLSKFNVKFLYEK